MGPSQAKNSPRALKAGFSSFSHAATSGPGAPFGGRRRRAPGVRRLLTPLLNGGFGYENYLRFCSPLAVEHRLSAQYLARGLHFSLDPPSTSGGRESSKVDENFRNTNTRTELGLILRPEKPGGDWKPNKGVAQMPAKHVLIAACTFVVLGGGLANAGPCNTGQNADNKAGQEAKRQAVAEQPKSAGTTGQSTAGDQAPAPSSKMTDTNQSPTAPSQGADTSTKMPDKDC
jgi:hypothetical protein